MNKKTIASAIMAAICCVCLITGATYALFTSQSSANIAIGSGKVDVTASIDGASLETYSGRWNADTASYDSVKQEGTGFANGGSAALGPDGGTLTLDKMTPMDKAVFAVKIVNNSNVAIAYRVSIKSAQDSGLFNGLEVRVADNKDALAAAKPLARSVSAWINRAAPTSAAETETQYLSVELPQTADSRYADSACAVAITVEAVQGNAATQDEAQTVEKIAVGTPESLQSALASEGDTHVVLTQDIAIDAQLSVNGVKMLDLNGYAITNATDIWDMQKDAVALIKVKEGDELTIVGDGAFKAKDNDCYAVNMAGGKCVIEGGSFVGNISVVNVIKGELIVNGGTFTLSQLSDGTGEARYRYLLNCVDKNYTDGSAKITVTGGTFVNFNPANNAAEGEGNSFVPTGYRAQSKQNGDKTEYTVVKD